MKLRDYIREKSGWIILMILQLVLLVLMGKVFSVNPAYIISVVFFEVVISVCFLTVDFRKKSIFYNDMLDKLGELDKKYLITEMIEKPGFLEGDIFCDALYDVNKSMSERVSEKERSVSEFKEYVEMWIHEIKLPISALSLMDYNEKADFHRHKMQVDKIFHYVEQILYYVRAGAPQKDFLMNRCSLDALINAVLLENKEVLIKEKFTIEKEKTDTFIVSDAKWVSFMLGQIINNSIKYKKGERGYLKFSVSEDADQVLFSIEDHGIGVNRRDTERVFEKSFTGENGRKVAASTGMGLYICRKMCRKLGHDIWMESEEGEFTRITIRFGKNDYYFWGNE